MSCHGCAEKFGFLKKELGCPKCGFAYCKKCLRFQITDSKSKKQVNVCFKCQQTVQSPAKEPIAVINALHRLESMDDPAKPPITVYRQRQPVIRNVRLQELKRGLSFEDQKILERLESLKQEDDSDVKENIGSRRKSERMEEEIAERLARLKGEEYNPDLEKKSLLLKNVKPETEEDVIAKFAAEVEMDTKYESSVVSDIEARLAKLRGETVDSKSESGPSSAFKSMSDLDVEELTEEEQVKLIMQRFQEEVAIDKSRGGEDSSHAMDVDATDPGAGTEDVDPESDEDIDVDDLCGICSEKRATLKCEECDGDIFCNACFKELHMELGEVHQAKVIKKK